MSDADLMEKGQEPERLAKETVKPLLRVRNLCTHFPIYDRGIFKKQIKTIRAVDDVSFDLMPGETLGIVGESGSGKTTAGRSIIRAVRPTTGEVFFRHGDQEVDLAQLTRRDLGPLRTKMQMIFQDPFASLNPRMTVRDIIAEPLVINRLASGDEREQRVIDMLERVGLRSEHRMRYPHAFSGGQRQRIGIARALICRPSLIIADEAVSALDVSVQAQVINLMKELQREMHLTSLFIAHDLSVVKHICDRVAVMYAGKIVEIGETKALFADPKHPYTQSLLASVPNPNPRVRMHDILMGEVADPGNLPSGCSFHPRCPHCTDTCKSERPTLRALNEERSVRCPIAESESK